MSYYPYNSQPDYSTGYKHIPDTCNSYAYYTSHQGYHPPGHYNPSVSSYNSHHTYSSTDYTSYNSAYTQANSSYYNSGTSYSQRHKQNYPATYTTQSSSYPVITSPRSKIMSIDTTSDPVTKAVIDNMIGKVSAKIRPRNLGCTLCGITALSQATLDTHLAGSKHARKVKEIEIKQQRDVTEYPGIKKLGSIYRCVLCEADVNSLHQLQAHLNGSRHKMKLNPQNGENAENIVEKSASTSTDEPSNKSKKKTEPKEITQYYCTACNVCSNSRVQYEQHVSSSKHRLRLEGKKVPRKPYMKQSAGYSRNITLNSQPLNFSNTPKYDVNINSSFVRGGTVLA